MKASFNFFMHARRLAALSACAALAACGGSGHSDRGASTGAPANPGIFVGSIKTDNGIAALATAVIAANGRSTVSLEENSDAIAAVIAGTTNGNTLRGSLYRAGSAAEAVSIGASNSDNDTLSGNFSSAQLRGTFTLHRERDIAVSLADIAANYRFVGGDHLTWDVNIAADGTLTATSGSCAFSGKATLPSATHNTYQIDLTAGNCAPFSGSVTALAFLDAYTDSTHVSTSPTLRVIYIANDTGVDLLWFRQ